MAPRTLKLAFRALDGRVVVIAANETANYFLRITNQKLINPKHIGIAVNHLGLAVQIIDGMELLDSAEMSDFSRRLIRQNIPLVTAPTQQPLPIDAAVDTQMYYTNNATGTAGSMTRRGRTFSMDLNQAEARIQPFWQNGEPAPVGNQDLAAQLMQAQTAAMRGIADMQADALGLDADPPSEILQAARTPRRL